VSPQTAQALPQDKIFRQLAAKAEGKIPSILDRLTKQQKVAIFAIGGMAMRQQTQTPPALATSIKIPGELKERIQSLAEARQRTPHALMLQALETFVTREEQRESLRLEARAAHEEYMRTGLHVTAEEADAWLAELEAGNDVEPPKCHV
jgi:predicted transcriptional regulator